MQWYVYWDFKAKDRDKLYSLVKKGAVVLDIGTNIGETLLNFAKLSGEMGYVYGFEPDEENYANAQKNIALNDFKNIHVFKLGLSDKAERVKFYCVEPHNRGMNRILENDEGVNAAFITIQTVTLDSIVKENNITKIDIIKIDIEGYEMHALRGAVETLKRFKPDLFIEIGYTRLLKNKTSPNELIKLLEDIGYAIVHSKTESKITSSYDFSYLGEGGMDVVASAK